MEKVNGVFIDFYCNRKQLDALITIALSMTRRYLYIHVQQL